MKKSLSFWQFAGFTFTGVAGTLLHFLYDWTNSRFIALFSAVNESIWEHMKLLFFPMIVFAIFESFCFSKEYKSFWCSKLVGILLGLATIPILYYSYTGILGVSADWFNIAIFYIAAAVSYLTETRLLENNKCYLITPRFAKTTLLIIAVLFIVLTFKPPHIPLFKDPVTNLYGII